ncbi:hypothetical protein Tcan_09260 [Toxocara canis]|uniref:Uncharacterized protein n=1 Tax=Toxocara canis TaxID=6265 RepID=A0A0B2VXI8_TOXCA|nr:hypothetical protein Tcan_09260 [Toxocara canis]
MAQEDALEVAVEGQAIQIIRDLEQCFSGTWQSAESNELRITEAAIFNKALNRIFRFWIDMTGFKNVP